MTPREFSFKAAHEALQSFHLLLLQATEGIIDDLLDWLAKIVGEHIVGNRLGRKEPRANKRRPKPSKRLQHSRRHARKLKIYQK